MIERRVTVRYVRGLLEAAHGGNCIDAVLQALKEVDGFIRDNKAVTKMLYNPTVLRERKKKLLCKLLPEEAPGVLKKFMVLVIEKKRERIIESLYREYETAANTLRGVMMARVVSVMELSEGQIERLKGGLEKGLNRKIEIKTEIDKSILGGIQVFIGTNVVDGSVTGRINRLKKHLSAEISRMKPAA